MIETPKSDEVHGGALEVSKLVATGNDFIFVDARNMLPGNFAVSKRDELARRLCDRHFGVGADGLVFVEETGGRFGWDFYNNDGSHAEMCGNATRCMGRWASRREGLSSIEFATKPGRVMASVSGDLVESRLDFVSAKPQKLVFDLAGASREAMLVNTGVPHAVVEVANLEDSATSHDLIRALRHHPATGPRGANVTFLEIVAETKFRTTTFERGVEGFTLSCGTGVMAAAAVGLARTNFRKATLETPGGTLEVRYGDDFQGVTLAGPAEFVFQTHVSERILR